MLDRPEKAGSLAAGAVDSVLTTVANNLVVTNNLNHLSDLRCRVMLTSPLELFAVARLCSAVPEGD